MMTVTKVEVVLSTNATGGGTAQSGAPVSGHVAEVRLASSALLAGGTADLTVTRLHDGGTILKLTNASAAPFQYQPRPAQHTTSGGTTEYAGAVGPVLDPLGVPCDDFLKVVIAQGAQSAAGTLVFHVVGSGS